MYLMQVFTIGITLVDKNLNWLNWFHFLILSICYSHSLHDFSVAIPRCYRHVYANSFYHPTARPWNYFSTKCISLIYYPYDFQFKLSKQPLILCLFWSAFPHAIHLWPTLFFVTLCLVVGIHSRVEWVPIKNLKAVNNSEYWLQVFPSK